MNVRDATAARRAAFEDIPVLVQMMREFYAESGYPLDEQWAAATFSALLANDSLGGAWIAYRDPQAAGYVVLTIRFSMEHGGLEGAIDDLFVRPAHRRRGVARTLVDALVAEGKRRHLLALHVEVGKSNAAAKALYARYGLQPRADERETLTALQIADSQPLFVAGEFRAMQMAAADVPMLQRFYQVNPEYHVLVMGVAPSPKAGQETFERVPPDDWQFTRKWTIAFRDEDGEMVAIADVVEDLLAKHVWHLGLYIVATGLHGSGAAREMYRGLEEWIRRRGATWLRLGVVAANPRGERFWKREGYAEIRRRDGVVIGERTHTLLTMVKPLAAGSLQEYLAMVDYDRMPA